eukprot:5758373-Lingulodinium_polyedra.AAC.1
MPPPTPARRNSYQGKLSEEKVRKAARKRNIALLPGQKTALTFLTCCPSLVPLVKALVGAGKPM